MGLNFRVRAAFLLHIWGLSRMHAPNMQHRMVMSRHARIQQGVCSQ